MNNEAARMYERMSANLERVRRTLARPLTLADKVVLGHLDDPATEDLVPGKSYLALRPDRVVFQDVLGQTGLLQFMQTGREKVAVPASVHCDHLIQARTDGLVDLRSSLAEHDEIYKFLRTAALKYGLEFWGPGAGIIHQVVLENYAFPGAMIIGTDSHTPNAGGLGACAVGVGGADAVEVLAGLPWELLYPKHIAVYLSGELSGWTAPKDVILWVAGQLGVSGGTNAIVEYIGPGARTISATGKATITNMGAELGATTSMFPADERMLRYLRATGRGGLVPIVERHLDLLEPDREVERSPEKYYERVLELDLSKLEPHVVGPGSPDRARPISELAAEVREHGFPAKISAALIGSCTNSSYEDMTRAADIAAQAKARGISAQASLWVTPGSEQIRATTERDGQLLMLKEIGGTILANACGPCIGQWSRAKTEANTIVTSYNRNFPGRNDGQATTLNFIASPELVTALAIAGTLEINPLTDSLIDGDGKPFRFRAPLPAADIPAAPFVKGEVEHVSAQEDGSAVELTIDPKSERLHMLEPWPRWDGRDVLEAPVLIKTKGKTTTDHISPAGAWLRYRGHLHKFSDNFLSGALNAWTGETGTTANAITGGRARPIAEVARAYDRPWVVVGDWNYGEGSSREHAALSPRLLGGAAVISRSFARIHETNLKKQGLLALTFEDAADYDLIREGDRLSLVDLAKLEPGKPVACVVHHADGTVDPIRLVHSYSRGQLAWFREGSALNAARQRDLRRSVD